MNYDEIKRRIETILEGRNKATVLQRNLSPDFANAVQGARNRVELSKDGLVVKVAAWPNTRITFERVAVTQGVTP